MKAIETNGMIENERRLLLDDPLPILASNRVRVIVLMEEEHEVEEQAWQRSAAANPAFAFLQEPQEDIYTPEDGKPFHDEG